MSFHRGIINGLMIVAVFWGLVAAGIYFVYDSNAESAEVPAPAAAPCTCANKPADSNCQHVKFDNHEGGVAVGVIWGDRQSCLVIRPPYEIEIDG